ncbi:MAG: hypothetical protein IJM65_01740 [Bacteroidales bacterium]|jgi:hypothetical protein|nr:hypothetical protein [Bacteroidales bacterium]MBQ6666821.1 hypothetical protein [Bacteroidales bacterium]MBR4512616.1 hypothetical protein [Bacteroidales bacterium]
MYYQVIRKIGKTLLPGVLLLALLISAADAEAQNNRRKQKNNFSKSGKSLAVMRHGLTLGVGASLMDVTPMVGLGYACSQYYGIGNRFMQQSIMYQIGLGDDMIHNVVGTFHCSFVGTWDMSPCIYGLGIHFAMAPDKYSETNMGNLYLRPEFGLYFPTKYRKRTQEKLPITGSLTYGYNYGLFMTRTEMESYREKYGITSDADLPWTSVNHHMITFRINFNFANIREFQ